MVMGGDRWSCTGAIVEAAGIARAAHSMIVVLAFRAPHLADHQASIRPDRCVNFRAPPSRRRNPSPGACDQRLLALTFSYEEALGRP
jgi:hypothetical protein